MKIVPLKEEHLPALLAIRNDPSTIRFLGDKTKFNLDECQEWFRKTKPDWKAVLIDNNLVGYIRIHDRTKDSVWIGCDLDPLVRGKGLGQKSLELVIQEEFSKNTNTIYLEVFEDNVVARHIYSKLGFEETSIRIMNNINYIKMTLTKDRYAKIRDKNRVR